MPPPRSRLESLGAQLLHEFRLGVQMCARACVKIHSSATQRNENVLRRPWRRCAVGFASTVAVFVLLARVGLVASIAAAIMQTMFEPFPIAWPPAGWYWSVSFLGIAVTAGIAYLGYRLATEGRRERPIG